MGIQGNRKGKCITDLKQTIFEHVKDFSIGLKTSLHVRAHGSMLFEMNDSIELIYGIRIRYYSTLISVFFLSMIKLE